MGVCMCVARVSSLSAFSSNYAVDYDVDYRKGVGG